MPLLQIRSLPFETEPDISGILEGIMQDYCLETGAAQEHVSATWEYIPAGHYGAAGQAAWNQPRDSHPVLVELITPNTHSPSDIGDLLSSVANILSRRAGLPITNFFIQYRPVKPGTVYDNGKVIHW